MEKLTRERMAELWSNGGGFITMLNEAWQAIEADREAIREETREEVRKILLRDHFKLGEELVISLQEKNEHSCRVAVISTDGKTIYHGDPRSMGFSIVRPLDFSAKQR